MRILLAIGNDAFSSILRMHLFEAGFDVLDNDVYHRNFLPEILEFEKPDIVIIHDVYLPSDTLTEGENEKELLQYISSWRIQFNDDLRVVLLSERQRQDPFLRSLVAHNVLDIFAGRQISTSVLINQLQEQPRFTNVARYGVGQLTDPILDKAVEETNSAEPEETITTGATKTESIFNRFQPYVRGVLSTLQKNPVTPKSKKETGNALTTNDVVIDAVEEVIPIGIEEVENKLVEDKREELVTQTPTRSGHRARGGTVKKGSNDLIPLPTTVYRERLIGTALFAITSIGPNIGATHTSIQLASFLKRKGHTVAIVEANESGDFSRIRELFDLSEEQIDIPFYVDEIPHYPYEGENIIPFLSKYQFLVIDLGAYEKTPLFSEFFRAQKRMVVASGADWKLSLIGNFIKKHGKVPFHVTVPMANDKLIRDLEEIYDGETTFSSLPIHLTPYKEQADTNAAFDELYSTFLNSDTTYSSHKSLKVWLSIASVAAAIGIFGMAYMFFA